MRVTILGCGYTGLVLGARLLTRGDTVVATTTQEARVPELEVRGFEARVVNLTTGSGLSAALEGADAAALLAPPTPGQSAEALASTLVAAGASRLTTFVYGSTTGVYGPHPGVIDEDTTAEPAHARGRARLEIEAALAAAGLPLKTARIAGIYGPGRTLAESLRRGTMALIEGAPTTSRIHVEDLARILEALLAPSAPTLVLCADESPATTAEVARFTASLIGMTVPDPIPLETARAQLSPIALEMRLGGHTIRSRRLAELLPGGLQYPSYRQGVPASLAAELS